MTARGYRLYEIVGAGRLESIDSARAPSARPAQFDVLFSVKPFDALR